MSVASWGEGVQKVQRPTWNCSGAQGVLVTHLVDTQHFDKNDEDAHAEIHIMSSFRGQGRGQRHATLAKGNIPASARARG